mmetsp:Transcript_5630/g.12760  ORF Transcript_5630/g.12760 Transcript_5630/m.12760 type:complete len:104 (+) Transcript_5630:2351-2662(+)
MPCARSSSSSHAHTPHTRRPMFGQQKYKTFSAVVCGPLLLRSHVLGAVMLVCEKVRSLLSPVPLAESGKWFTCLLSFMQQRCSRVLHDGHPSQDSQRDLAQAI